MALGEQDEVVDRVICVVNNDAITQFDVAEAEAFHYFERKEEPPPEEARQQVRARILGRMIDSRLQLQQAQRESIAIEEAEVREGLAEIMKQLKVRDEAELAPVLKAQGATLEQARKRIREQLMVQKVVRRKVALRVTVTEQEVDRYFQDNREKLETGLTFEARHMLFLPGGQRGPAAWDAARQARRGGPCPGGRRRRLGGAGREVLGGWLGQGRRVARAASSAASWRRTSSEPSSISPRASTRRRSSRNWAITSSSSTPRRP